MHVVMTVRQREGVHDPPTTCPQRAWAPTSKTPVYEGVGLAQLLVIHKEGVLPLLGSEMAVSQGGKQAQGCATHNTSH